MKFKSGKQRAAVMIKLGGQGGFKKTQPSFIGSSKGSTNPEE